LTIILRKIALFYRAEDLSRPGPSHGDKNAETARYLAVHQYVENLPTNANSTADTLLDIWQRTGKYHHNHACRAPINVFPADSFMHKFVEAMNKEPLEANKITITTDEQQCSKIKKSKM
jgi:hypothetical protein